MESTIVGGKRGQILTDFLTTLIVMLIITLIFAGIASEKYISAISQTEDARARQIAQIVALNVNAVQRAGDGAIIVVSIPESVTRAGDYNVSIYPSYHLVEVKYAAISGSRSFSFPLTTADLSGNLTNIGKTFTLRNVDGQVRFA